MRAPSGMAWSATAALLGAVAAGCSAEADTGRARAAASIAAIVDIAVDADRDGIIDLGSEQDQAHEDTWSAQWGASFLCNLDDDDGNGVPDAQSPEIDVSPGNEADAMDLARIVLAPWPAAPQGSVGTLWIDSAAVAHVRIHRLQPDGAWTPLLGLLGPCGAGGDPSCSESPSASFEPVDLVAGVELGIEGLHLTGLDAAAGWDGLAELGWEVRGRDGSAFDTEEHPGETLDRVVMRQAPWIMRSNLDGPDEIYASDVSSDLMATLGPLLAQAGLPLRTIPWTGPDALDDQWTQDLFQFGFTAIPAADGTVHGMRTALARPYSYATLPIDWLERHYLGPDRSAVAVYRQPNTGNTFDSFGNHELVPPDARGDAFPLGRIVVGMPEQMLPETRAFYQTQGAQTPLIGLDTSWLAVGHVDEIFSFVPASTARGWKLLVASPGACTTLLQSWQQQGHGSEQMFVGKHSYNGIDAAVPIAEVLADPDMASWNQDAQAHIDELLDAMTEAVGLEPDEIIEVPVYFAQDEGLVAFVPNAVNALVLGNRFMAADPFGPAIEGEDGFKRDLRQRLEAPSSALGSDGQGLQVGFVDDWDWYHLLLGEVHCASNADGPPASRPWWGVGR